MRYLFLVCLLCSSIYTNAQYNIIYENSFRNWAPGQGWVMLNNDTIPKSAGMITNSHFGGVPVPFYLEIYDYMLGVDQTLSATDKIMITPPLLIGDSTFVRYYSKYNSGSELSLWVLPFHNDTTLSGLTDSLGNSSSNGFNVYNLSAYSGDTVRLAFRIRGLITKGFIDNLIVLDKYSLAWVPDVNFRNYLKTQIPVAFTGDSLDFIAPSVINMAQIVSPNSQINTLEGLQYFVGLKYLNVANNSITYIPPDKLTFLDSANAENNFLPIFPDAPLCRKLRLNNNLIKNIPDLYNDNLDVLQMKNNLLYDCLTCSNRFVQADLTSNIYTTRECTYYNAYFTPNPGSLPPPVCGLTMGKIKGKAYYDINQNSTYDTTDVLLQNQHINFAQGTDLTTMANGSYLINVDSGLVNMSLTALPAGFICNTPLIDTISSQEVIIHDFIVSSTSNFTDLSVSLNATGTTRLNESLTLSINVKNIGTQTASGDVKMFMPSGYTLINLQKGSITNDTLTWNVNVTPFRSENNLITIRVDSFPINQETHFNANLSIVNDINLSNNTDTVGVMIRDSLVTVNPPFGFPYDPNNKLVDQPIVIPGFQDYLTYNINFENIGTGNASRVMVRDYLSSKLDISTFELLSTSHPCIVSFGADSLIQFLFEPIVLTPTSIDSINSHGHIWFRIKPTNPVYLNDTIYNSAGIYFDLQPPILTNTSMVYAATSGGVQFIVNNDTLCGSGNVQFRNQSGGQPLSIEWQFPGGNPITSTLSSPIVNYNSPGTYDVILIAKYVGHNDTLFKPFFIKVHSVTPATIILNGNDSICKGDSVLLSASHPGTAYQWTFNQTTPSIYASTSAYYQLTITDSNGCRSLAPYIYINVLDPSPVITGIDTFCSGTSTSLTTGLFSSYLWSNGATTRTTSVSSAGLYIVTVTNSFGCTGVDSIYMSELNAQKPTITGQDSICLGSSTQLSAGTGYLGYLWSTGASTPNITVNNPGAYIVTVTDSLGCQNKDTFQLSNILLNPLTSNSDSICSGSQLIIEAGAGFIQYVWNTGDTTQQILASSPGYYSVTVEDVNGCTVKDSLFLTLISLPIPIISGSDTLCSGLPLAVTNTYSSYSWSNGGNTNSIYPTSSGIYSVTVTDQNGCTGSASKNVIVISSPVPIISGIDTVCLGEPGLLITGTYLSYLWSNGSSQQSIDPTIAGNYFVTVTDFNGCTGIDSIEFVVLNLPNPFITGDDTICIGSQTLLDAGAGFISYQWSTQDSSSQIVVSNAGTYWVTVIDSFGCTISVSHQLFTSTVDTSVTVNGFTLLSLANTASWQWMYCDSSIINGANGISFTATQNGSYAVIVSENGCTDTSNCYPMIVTGVEVLEDGFAALFPNPATTELNLTGISNQKLKYINIYSSTGQLVKNVLVEEISDNFKIDISLFSSGLYYLDVNLESENKRFKFIVLHDE